MPIFALAAALCVRLLSSTQTLLLRDPAPDLFQSGRATVRELPPLDPGIVWDEAIPSWNLDNPECADLEVEARVVYPGRSTKYFSFGRWTGSVLKGLRSSVKGQRDADGDVLTDTLRMTTPGGRLQFRLTGRILKTGRPPKLRRMYATFSGPKTAEDSSSTLHPAWGLVLDPPQFAQGDYPEGKGLCSPTCVAMVLDYWAGRDGVPAIRATVPQVQSSVYDAVYAGTGNWAFNASYAGSKRGMTGFVCRMQTLDQLESWIGAGVPVICSVGWYLLHGEEVKPDEEGHLVVLIGFTPDGDPVFNDPGQRGSVRKVYRRADFDRAWQRSNRTTYVICPQRFVADAGGRIDFPKEK